MNQEINNLKIELENLKAENNRLKTTGLQEVFSFGFLFDAVKQPAFILEAKRTDSAPVIAKVNISALELVKFELQECLQLSPIELGLFTSQDQYQKYSTSLSAQESVSYLSAVKTKNGNPISSELTLYSFSEGDHIHLLIFQRNVGNQQKVLEALRQSEYRFLQMAENVAEGIVIVEEGKTVFINSSMTQITGYNKDQMRDMDEYSLAREDERERVKSFLQKIDNFPTGIHVIEFWITTRMGQEKCIKSNYTFSNRSDGRRTTYVISSDITSRKRIEQALRKSQNEFRMLAENSPDLITRYNKDLTYSYANLTLETILGIPIAQFLGRNNLELDLDPDLISFLEEMHLEVFRTGRTIKFEYRISTTEEVKVFQALLVPELSAEGTVESVLNVSRDITQIKQVERSLKDEKQSIIETNMLIGQNLKSWCQNFCNENEKKPIIYNNTCLEPILRIAEWTQYNYTSDNLAPKNFIVNNLIKDFFNQHAPLIQQQGLEANLLLPVHEISIYSDEQVLTYTLNLLLENALEATLNGKIEIGFDIYNEKEIVIFIKDTGIGIEPDQTEQIFKPFVSINKENHAGLGLSIAEKNVNALNGILWCLSSPGTGTTFCFTHAAQIEKSLLQSKNENRGLIWKNKKVLVVEDTETNYLLIEGLLSQYGAELEWVLNGTDAIQKIKQNPSYDLVLMDIQLPGINGYETTAEIRKFNTTVPIIAQTAYAMYDDVVRALDAGCNDFLAKPIKTKKFIGLIDKYLST